MCKEKVRNLFKSSVDKDFLKVFSEGKKYDLDGNNLNLFSAKIENNEFKYSTLVDSLFDVFIDFCLSSKEKSKLGDGRKYVEAASKFRKYESNTGELGELLLFSFLETHLEAPKILSKMLLKTSTNDYVKGADGIHLKKLADGAYHLIFGESKLYKSIRSGVRDAFESIEEYINREKNNINDEVKLIGVHLPNEFEKEEHYEMIKRIIFPSEEEIELDKAFGIFTGFEIKFTDEELKIKNQEFRIVAKKKIEDMVERQFEFVKKQIDEKGLQAYTFYIYFMPFTDIDNVRKKIIENLMGAKNDF